MPRVKVYLYDYFDGLLKCDRRSTDYATADAIAQRRGTILAESERLVDEGLLDDQGLVPPRRLPPREEVPAVRTRHTPAGERRLGSG
jgi:hypothetical protein